MTRRKKTLIILAVAFVLIVIIIAQHVLGEMGSILSASERNRQYGHLSYYNTETNEFVSPDEVTYFPERTTGGSSGFGRFFSKSPNAPKEDLPTVKLTKADFPAVPSAYALPAVHYSGRSGRDRNQTLWAAYAIKGNAKNIFWSGDTGYGKHIREIGETYGPFDLACIEIDGWNDGWPNTHLFPHEAVQVAHEVGAPVMLPTHWGVFDLALHPWNESIQMTIDVANDHQIQVLTPLMGERIVPGETVTKVWW